MSLCQRDIRKPSGGDIMTALYDDPDTALRAVERLHAAGVSSDHISVVTDSAEAVSTGPLCADADEGPEPEGLLQRLLSAGIPDYEAALYERRVRDGGALVGVGVNGDVRDVHLILSAFNPVKTSLR